MNTITLAKLLKALINGNDYPAGTNVIINRKELVYCDNKSWYNNLLYMHKETGSYLYVQHTDDENYVRINIIYIFRLETFNTNKHLLYKKAQCLFVFFNIF